jgi:hypothetical protein
MFLLRLDLPTPPLGEDSITILWLRLRMLILDYQTNNVTLALSRGKSFTV